MFQNFQATTRPEDGPPRLARLRRAMAEAGLDGVVVPRADAHQGEYVAPCDDRLAWLTGFTGSAGFACILADRAGVFVDGRYRVQVKAQVADAFTPVNWPETKLAEWLKAALPQGGRIGFDPWLHPKEWLARQETALSGSGVALVPGPNLIDAIWTDRPPRPAGPVRPYPDDLAGETAAAKRARIAKALAEAGQSAAVLTLPDSLSWLLNLRGSDLPRVPVVQAFGILYADGRVRVFSDPAKFAGLPHDPDLDVAEWDAFAPALAALTDLTGPVRVDKATAPLAVGTILAEAGAEIVYADDPCILPKATKTPAEIAATTEAHLRDGAAMAHFLAWLNAEADRLTADPAHRVTEIDVVRALEGFRRATNRLEDISFDTIAGAGPHGAIVHYRVTEATDRALAPGEVLLVDSGGQYLDGTTDITRTVAIGPPPAEAQAAFTRVLQGLIAISRARWPRGLVGRDLDALARYPLWLAGQDYDHGTGHGVGQFLSVHEGPQRLSRLSEVALAPGMILSNEPGYYREGAFGIRIENLIAVTEAPALPGADPREMLAFRTLTYAPIDRRLILADRLSAPERAWLNAYHAEVYEKIAPRLDPPTRAWLAAACEPV